MWRPTRFYPLYLQILGWFVLNVLLVGALIWWLVHDRFTFSAVPERGARENMNQAAEEILAELKQRPRGAWNDVMQKAAAKWGVSFRLCDTASEHVATDGSPSEIAPGAHGAWFIRRGPGRGQRPGPPRPEEWSPEEGGRRPLPPPPKGPRPEPATGWPSPENMDKFIRTESPTQYWLSKLIFPDAERFPQGLLLVVNSPTLTGNGFFFDLRPYIWGGVGMLCVSLLIWFPFIRSLTLSLSRLRSTTQTIAEGHFEVRTEVSRSDEVGALGREINRMAERLGGHAEGQRRFLCDVSHELSAPIARLQFATDILEASVPQERERLQDIREEVEHMGTLVGDLLQFSKATIQAQAAAPTLESVLLGEIVAKAIQQESAGPLTLAIPEHLRVQAVPDLLQRAVANVLRNARCYAAGKLPLEIQATATEQHVLLEIRDHGPGIPTEALARIFDPFFRLDVARNASTGGTGLGLSIVKSAITACGGQVTLENHPQGGLVVKMHLLAGPSILP